MGEQYRKEVREIQDAHGTYFSRDVIAAIIELGVRLGLEAAQAEIIDESTSLGKRIVEAIRANIAAIDPASVLREPQP